MRYLLHGCAVVILLLTFALPAQAAERDAGRAGGFLTPRDVPKARIPRVSPRVRTPRSEIICNCIQDQWCSFQGACQWAPWQWCDQYNIYPGCACRQLEAC